MIHRIKMIQVARQWSVMLSQSGTEHAEHIQIIITSTQEAVNLIPTQDWSCGLSLSTIRVGLIKTARNIRI